MLLALGPAVGALIGFLALGETLTVRQLIAMALVAAGAWTVRRRSGGGPDADPGTDPSKQPL